jgi:FkbM family methyltransferase
MRACENRFKSMLLRAPPLYALTQRLRDWQYLSQNSQASSHSQHGEDVELARMLRELEVRGPYLDVGCNHPFRICNTYLLYGQGWRGQCVDPLPRFAAIYRRWRPEDVFRDVAIGEESGNLELFEFEADVLSTLDVQLADQYVAMGYRLRRRLPVPVQRIDQLLSEAKLEAPLSLLSIEIEGYEVQALRTMDLARWQPALVCIEALTAGGVRNSEALDYLLAHGYVVHSDLGLNVVFRRKAP